MVMDWKLSKLQREHQAKREQLAALNAELGRLEGMLAEARDFEDWFSKRLAEAERRLSEVSPRYAAHDGFLIARGDEAEYTRRLGAREAIKREGAEEMKRRTTTGSDGYHILSFCALRSADIIGRRRSVVILRDQVARELAAIEEQLSPGELVTSGVPASEYTEHRQRVAALRERIGQTS